MISFCTVCKGRLWQLKQTIFHNLNQLETDCELVLLDYQSPDGLEEFIKTNFNNELKSGKLRCFKLLNDYNYSSPYAKNVVHKLAKGNILFNLDGDNFIQEGLIDVLRKLPKDTVLNGLPKGRPSDTGSFGRLGYHVDLFNSVCGYNEHLIGMSKGDDIDLIQRALKQGFKLKGIATELTHIKNNDDDKFKYVDVSGLEQHPLDYPNKWGVADVENYIKTEA